nr:MAG TPA: hypothetical protein [Caudoviricetes sp.]
MRVHWNSISVLHYSITVHKPRHGILIPSPTGQGWHIAYTNKVLSNN